MRDTVHTVKWPAFVLAVALVISACTTETDTDTEHAAGLGDPPASASASRPGSPDSSHSTPTPPPTGQPSGADPETAAAPIGEDVSPTTTVPRPIGETRLTTLAGAPPTLEIKKPKDGKRIKGEIQGGQLGAFVDLEADTTDPVTGALVVRWELDGAVVATGTTIKDVWIPRGPDSQWVTIVAIGSSNGIDAAFDSVTFQITPTIEIKKPDDGKLFPGEEDGSGNIGTFMDLDSDTKPLKGDTMDVRWIVNGTIVATGEQPRDVWIPRGGSDPVIITAIGSVDGVDVALDDVAVRIGPTLEIKKPEDGKQFDGEYDPTLGTYLDLEAEVEPLDGSPMTIRWLVDGAVVATGEKPQDVWIPRPPDSQEVTIVAIGTVGGVDVSQDQVTIWISPWVRIKQPDPGEVFEGGFDPTLGRGAMVELEAETKDVDGDTVVVRWEVDGVVVAAGESPGDVWIPSTTDVDMVTIVAIGTVNGQDLTRDSVTIIIFAPSDV